tara:strand:- start:550 stop:981 length:432 start_codon:yes stop_codon:yes gene_type:complete
MEHTYLVVFIPLRSGSGTIRSNLDPFNTYSDSDLWDALDSCNMREYVMGLEAGLDAPVEANGNNFSAGQKQLLCISRSMLQDVRVLLLDEATSSVDPKTDEIIQQTIRSERLKECTVITIAHRLRTGRERLRGRKRKEGMGEM